jgi:hypothetical protein
MHRYTNVVFDRFERQILEAVGLHVGVAYPNVHTEMPRKQSERSPDHEARVVFQLVRDPSQGTHENLTRAVAVVEHLVDVLVRESALGYWLDTTERETGTRPPLSDEPTSAYQNLRVLSEIRAGQLRNAIRALALLRNAARVTSPRIEVDIETGAYADTAV